MRIGSRGALIGALGMALAGTAGAHEFVCEKTVDGVLQGVVGEYPATVTWDITIRNIHPTEPSQVLAVADPILAPFGFNFDPPTPFWVPVGSSVTDSFELEITSYEQCLQYAGGDGVIDGALVNTFFIQWDTGYTMCTATLTCEEPENPPPPPDGSGTTRTIGFYKNHPVAMQACLDGGAITLGSLVVDSLEEAEGLLWGVPARYENGTNRTDYDRHWYILARQTLVATCNQRLFGTASDPTGLIDDAHDALNGTDCDAIADLVDPVTAFNESGHEEPFPVGFDPGAQSNDYSEEDDPSVPSGLTCGPM